MLVLTLYPVVSAYAGVTGGQVLAENPDFQASQPVDSRTNFPEKQSSFSLAAFQAADPEGYAAYQTFLARLETYLQGS